MQGELGTSHAFESGGDYRPQPRYIQGHLGAEFEYDSEADGWRITRIYHGDVWVPDSDSPLHQPGMGIQAGDCLLAINARRLGRSFSPDMALVNMADQEVTLTILPQASAGEPSATRTVILQTLRSETPARYRAWVKANRQRVHQFSGGRIGYVHIPDMKANGYAEFHRGFLVEAERDGLIVDVRFNKGGNVSELILEKLARRRIAYEQSRWRQQPTPYPRDAVAGPMLALTNEYAASDADIFSHSFKLMKLGLLVGKRTWGGVIGFQPMHDLADGTETTQPEFSFWFSDVGWEVENRGTDPDIEVDILPQDYVLGVDSQLQRAIQEILKLLEAEPPRLPDFSNKPSKAPPRLSQA
jgi:tricorn protease